MQGFVHYAFSSFGSLTRLHISGIKPETGRDWGIAEERPSWHLSGNISPFTNIAAIYAMFEFCLQLADAVPSLLYVEHNLGSVFGENKHTMLLACRHPRT